MPTAPSSAGSGAVFVLTAADLTDTSLDDATYRFDGSGADDLFGFSTDGADIDGSGMVDILIGAPDATDTRQSQGILYIFRDPLPGRYSANAALAIPGEDSDDGLGTSLLALPDTDGHGQDDFLVGSLVHSRSGVAGGAVFYVLGEDLF